jgi:hypothetical protein
MRPMARLMSWPSWTTKSRRLTVSRMKTRETAARPSDSLKVWERRTHSNADAGKCKRIIFVENEAYSVSEVARLLRYSRRTIVRMFESEPGVIVIKHPEGKRRTLRIPRAVYQRVVHKMSVR